MSLKKKEPEDKIKKASENSERGGQIKKASGGSKLGNQLKKAPKYSEPVDQIKEGNQIKKAVEDSEPETRIMKIPEDNEPGNQINKTPECSKISGKIKKSIEDVTGLCTFEDFHINQPLVNDLHEEPEHFKATPVIGGCILKPIGQREAIESIKINEDFENDKEDVKEKLSHHRKWYNEMNKALEDVTWLCFLDGISNDQSMLIVDRRVKISELETFDIISNMSGLIKTAYAKKVHTIFLIILVESPKKIIKKGNVTVIEEKFIKLPNEIQDKDDKLANDAKYRELETANINTEQKSEEQRIDIHISTEKHTKQQPKEDCGEQESDGNKILQLEEPLKGIHTSTEKHTLREPNEERGEQESVDNEILHLEEPINGSHTSTEKHTLRQPNEERGEKESDDNEILHLDEESITTKFIDYKQETDSTKSSENSRGLRNTRCWRFIKAFSRKLKDFLGFCSRHLKTCVQNKINNNWRF